MRVKVRLGDLGLVIPFEAKDDTRVEALMKEIGNRFERQGIKPGELSIAALSTFDGYEISPYDLIKSVISDGEQLIALDYDIWAEKQDKWLEVGRVDFVDDVYKWIVVGYHEHNKLYVKFGTGYNKTEKVLRLELFDTEALQHFAKDGKVLIGSKEGNDGKWKEEAYFVVKNGTAVAIEVSVKSSSDNKPVVKQIGIKLGKQLQAGDVTVISDDIDIYDPKMYKLPPAEYTGPTIAEPTPAPAPAEKKENKSEGDSILQVTESDVGVEADQSYERDGEFQNFFYSNFTLLNKSEKKLAIAKVTSEYKNAEGGWTPMTTSIGGRYGYYNYSWDRPNETHFEVEHMRHVDLAVRSSVTIKSAQFEKERRAHPTLPQPLVIRITFEDVDGKKAVISVTQRNPPLNLVTIESREKYNNKKPEFYMQCDDTKLEARLYVEAYTEKEEDTMLYKFACNDSQNLWLRKTNLQRIIFEAPENATEHELDLKYSHAGCSVKAFAMIDQANKRVYAIKFVLTTTTSKAVDYYLLPPFSK